MSRKKVRCLNPNGCNFSMEWREGVLPPKSCPLCGFDKSHEEADRIKAKFLAMREAKRSERHEQLVAEKIMALSWWRRWLIGLGLASKPAVRLHTWTARTGIPYTFCAACGVVERRDFSNNACPGKSDLTRRHEAGAAAK